MGACRKGGIDRRRDELPVDQTVGNNYPHRVPVKTVRRRRWSSRDKPVVGAG